MSDKSRSSTVENGRDPATAQTHIAEWRTRDEPLSLAHISAFRRDGLLILRDVLSATELNYLDANVGSLIDWAWRTGRHEDVVWWPDPDEPGSVPVRIEYPMDKSAAVVALAGHPVMLAAVEALVGPSFIPTWDSLVFKVEQGAPPLPWHRDSGIYDNVVAVTGAGRVIDVGIYLDPAPPENCVWALPGTNYLDQETAQRRLGELNTGSWHDGGGIPAVMRPGDVLIHNILTLHSAPPTSSGQRRVVYFEYRPGEVEYYLGPHTREYVGLKQQVLLESLAAREASGMADGERPFEYRPANDMRLWPSQPLSTLRLPHADYWAWPE